ncbi:hypothetical protein [Rhodoferax mekongensis]|uniref:hypothetical protein n=1 Tax=Rhodoferax mekongensis TaxID=3068341 RepID=UPI0028BD1EFF|nr:hypothetical protein [Rhodoferax sp. TBRC 17199]MDT7517102.1 hypothetical protein [Rhodoferax sp. TBRC 17199]
MGIMVAVTFVVGTTKNKCVSFSHLHLHILIRQLFNPLTSGLSCYKYSICNMKRLLITAIALAITHSVSVAQNLNLRCEGEGIYAVLETSNTNSERSDKPGSSITNTTRQQTTRGAIRFRMNESGAKIKLPLVMLPDVMSREDSSGWLNVVDLNVSSSEISGKIDLSVFASADLHIDRKSGDLKIVGYNRKYNGICSRDSGSDQDTKF